MPPSSKGAVALPLTLLILAALYQGTSAVDYKCFGVFSNDRGTIHPRGDIIIEVGSSYEAYCLFNPEEVHVDDVYFETSGSDGGILDHTVVNSSAIMVEITPDKAASYNLKCLQGNGSFICQRTVYAGYKPQDVENFKCVSQNWQSLNCSWSVPENPVKVTYNFTYVIPRYQELRECPQKIEDGQNWCFWESNDFHDKKQYWSMIFTANNSLTQDPVEFRHNIDLYASVIPNMATNFAVSSLGPREVKLEWNLPHPIDVFKQGNVTQEVMYKIMPFRNIPPNSTWNMVDQWEESPPLFYRKTYSREIRGLQPYVEYEFMVRLHTGTGPIREEMWSKPALVTKITDAARPTVAPLTTLGMFEVEETKLHRDMYVNWKTVDPMQENGPNFGYEVRILDSDGRSVSSPVTTVNGYTKFSKLENDITYRFEIRPKNSEGLPEEEDVKAEVIVPRKAALISIPKYFKVIAYLGNDTTTYMARWRLPEFYHASQNIETVTLYWCKQSEYENRCQNKISWKIIDDPNSYVHNLTGYDTSTRYMFGISVNSNNSSSGIKWSGCIAKHGVQQPALEKFNYTYVSSTDVKLKWDLDCKAEAAQPKAFNISYCIAAESVEQCLEPEIYEEVEGESTVQHTVRNLHPYRHYLFYIATISDLGLGKWSKYRRVMTKPSKPSGPPRNITLIGKGQTWISLAWEPPLESEQNGVIDSYQIKHKSRNDQGFSLIKRNVREFNFTNLDPFTEYHFEVFPCTMISLGSACSETHSAKINVKTNIGAPGRIDSFQFNNHWLKWDFDECNAPNCSYELDYIINETTSSFNIPLRQDSVSLDDLNISCPVAQGDIPVSLRAISTDEEGHRLLGPIKEMKIRCPSEGSYIILVPFSVSNQYNTNLNIMAVPETFTPPVSYRSPRVHAVNNKIESLTHVNAPRILTLLSFHSVSNDNGNDQQPLANKHHEQISADDFSNQHLESDSGNGRQQSLFNNGANSQIEPQYSTPEYSQRQLQENWRWTPFTRQNKIMWFPVQFLQTRVPSARGKDLHSSLSNRADPVTSEVVGLDNFEEQDNNYHSRGHVTHDSYINQSADREPSTNSNQYESSSKYRAAADDNGHRVSCPLLELMKAKNVEIKLNASSENFELNIRGQGNFFKLLQNIDFPIRDHNDIESELASENIVHEMGGNDSPTTTESSMSNQELHQQDRSEVKTPNISSYRNTETNLMDQNSTHDNSFIDETSRFLEPQHPFNGNSSQTSEETRTSVFVDVETTPASDLPIRYASPSPQLEDSVSNDRALGRENGSFYLVNATKEPGIPEFVGSKNSINISETNNNNNLFSEPAGPDNIFISAVATVQNNSTVTNDNEPDNMKRRRPKRNIQVVPVIFPQITQRSQFPLLNFLQGRRKIRTGSKALNVPNGLPLNAVGISQVGEVGQSTDSIQSHKKRIHLRDVEPEQD